MKRVVFSLANGVDGEIVLADNLFTEFWSMIFQRHVTSLPIRPSSTNPDFVEGVRFKRSGVLESDYYQQPHIAEIRQQLVAQVNSHILELQQLGIDWQAGVLPKVPDFDDLNRIHRAFTTLIFTRTSTSRVDMTPDQLQQHKLRYFNMNVNHGWPYWFPVHQQHDWPEPVLGETRARAEHHLHLINSGVHEIENRVMYNPRRGIHNQAVVEQLPTEVEDVIGPKLDWAAKLSDGCTDSQKLDWNYESAYTDAVFSTRDWELNVYDLKNILGKDYQTCYLDHDNPYNFDITNTVGTTKGGFEILPGYELYHKNILRPWMREWGFDDRDTISRPIPIGRIDPDFLLEHFTIRAGQDPEQRNRDMRIVALDLIS